MFTNATILELFARARREEDLLPLAHHHPTGWRGSLRGLLRRVTQRPGPLPAPVPVPVQPRQRTR